MLIKCLECNKDISDTVSSCPHCGYVVKTLSKTDSKEHMPAKKRKAIFQFIALGAIFVAFFTPKIFISLPCLVIVTTAIISLFKKEPRWLLSTVFIVIAIFLLNASSPDFSNDSKYAEKMEILKWDWTNDENYSHIRGRVKNTGDKTVTYFEIKALYLDSNGNVLDTDFTNSGEDLLPGMSKEFDIMHKRSPEYKKVRIGIERARTKRTR